MEFVYIIIDGINIYQKIEWNVNWNKRDFRCGKVVSICAGGNVYCLYSGIILR